MLAWALSDDWRAAIPAGKIIMGAAWGEFEKLPADANQLPAGFENLSVAERIAELRKRREEIKASESAAVQALGIAKPKQEEPELKGDVPPLAGKGAPKS